jgi:hypothetical protein
MKTIYQCEGCSSHFSESKHAYECEKIHNMAGRIERLIDKEWNPPRIKDFSKWSNEDKAEFVKLVEKIGCNKQP